MSTRRGVGVGGDTRGIFDDAGPPSCRRVRQADGMIGNFCRDTAGTIGKWHSGQGAGAAGRGRGRLGVAEAFGPMRAGRPNIGTVSFLITWLD